MKKTIKIKTIVEEKPIKIKKIVEKAPIEIPYTDSFSYFFDGNHCIVKEGKVIGREKEEKVARRKIDQLNNL